MVWAALNSHKKVTRKEEKEMRNREVVENLFKRCISIEGVSEISTLPIKEVSKIAEKLEKNR